jgi:predicted HTH transcriptional regulator
VDQIDLWRQEPTEREVLEFKAARNQYDTIKLLAYCVAISNEGGGHLLLGISDMLPHTVVGTKAIDNPIGMSEKLFNKLHFRVQIEEVKHPGGRVVVVSIPGRPRGEARSLDGIFLMRCGQTTQAMTPEVLRKIFLEGEPDWLQESTGSRIGAARVLELLETEAFFRLLNLPYPSVEGVIQRLLNEKLLCDEGYGSYSIKRIGALLLARQLSQFPDLSDKAPRVLRYSDTSKLTQPIVDKHGTKGYAVGFQGMLRFVNENLPYEEIIQSGIRQRVGIVPEVVIRELLANALIHQDFRLHGNSVLVEIFSNRVEISNPGNPVIPVDRLIDGICSRNERVADLMRRLGICEERGSGIDKVVSATEVLHLPAPNFRATDQRTIFTVYGPREFGDMDRDERIQACYLHCCLKWERTERMTNQSLRERFHIPQNKTYLVSGVIGAAIEAGKIKPDEKAGTSKKLPDTYPTMPDALICQGW